MQAIKHERQAERIFIFSSFCKFLNPFSVESIKFQVIACQIKRNKVELKIIWTVIHYLPINIKIFYQQTSS